MKVRSFEVESEARYGAETGFLRVRSVHLRNVRDDGTRSRTYICDFVERPMGADAVVVAVYRRVAANIEVLLRECLRPTLHLGRGTGPQPVADRDRYGYFREVVAGILEAGDLGEAGICERAALEVVEEAGFRVDATTVRLLGAGSFPSPGSMPEKFWLTAVEVPAREIAEPAAGDGSPMEEGSNTVWIELDDAIAGCVAGEIEDAKTELVLRRLRDVIGVT
jgi:ADP-ribose pyrophosphatase